ncbi:MAG: hypothetical protein RR101_15170 [Burkholderiaceae bacterium]
MNLDELFALPGAEGVREHHEDAQARRDKYGDRDCVCDLCRFIAAIIEAEATAADAMTPGRWWRVLLADGSVWCETSDEDEARAELASETSIAALANAPHPTLQRLYQAEPVTEWRAGQ